MSIIKLDQKTSGNFMKRNKNSGSAVPQYVIIIVLIAIALVPIFFLTGKYIFQGFEDFYNLLKGNNNTSVISLTQNKPVTQEVNVTDDMIKNGKVLAGQLGGTNENPVQKCAGEVCTIDYGEFVLNGLPENFGEFVQSSGNSGGTDKLIAILRQIADQLEEKGDIAGAKEYRDLANLGHFAATIQNEVEKLSETYSSDITQFKKEVGYTKSFTVPEDIKEFLPTFPEIKCSYSETGSNKCTLYGTELSPEANPDILNSASLKSIALWQGASEVSPTGGYSTKSGSSIKAAMDDIKNRIINNPNYSGSMKGVTEELMLNINDLQDNMANMLRSIVTQGKTYEEDPEGYVQQAQQANTALKELVHPITSAGTNLNSALICSTGWNKDTGTKCHKPK